MPWPVVNKNGPDTVEIRRNYSDEIELWEELWQQSVQKDTVCDVTLGLEDGSEIRAHWCILMLCPYFKALRHSGLYEKKSKLDLTSLPTSEVRLSIEFLYRGKATVPKEELKDVIRCADYLQLDKLKFRCADYLRDYVLSVNNCVSMCTLASTYNLEGLYDESNRMLKRRFQEVMTKDDILQLMTESLKFLLGDQNLRYVGQFELFKLLVRWSEQSEDRRSSFQELFDLIDLNDITFVDIENVVKYSQLVVENEACRDKVQNHLSMIRDFDPNDTHKDVLVFAGGKRMPEHVATLVGKSSKKNDALLIKSAACYGYIVQDSRWVRLSNVPRRSSGPLAVKNNTELYIMGKEDVSWFPRLYKLPNKDVKKHWLECSLELPRLNTDEVFATVFCKDKLVSVRRENTNLYVCAHNPTVPTQSTVNTILYLKSLKQAIRVRICCFKDRYAFIVVLTSKGSNANKNVILDTEKGTVEEVDTKGMGNGEVFYQDGETVYLETPGKRFSSVFTFSNRRWTSVRRGLPALPNSGTLKRCQAIKIRDFLYVLGNVGSNKSQKNPELYRIREMGALGQTWEEIKIPSSDFPLIGAHLAHFGIERNLLRCPHDCTHCSHLFSYDDYNYDDEDDDDDFGDDDSLYRGYSDSDDDDLYPLGGFFFW